MIAKVLYNERIGEHYRRLGLSCHGVGQGSQPGQFVMLRINKRDDPFLARPFAIHRRRPLGPFLQGQAPEGIEILYRIVGKGTRILSLLTPDEEVELWGPLGRGFSIPLEIQEHMIVAGGVGVAPMLSLAEEIARSHKRLAVFIGGRSRNDLLCMDDFQSLNCELFLATEDGSEGEKALVSDLLTKKFPLFNPGQHALYASGPHALLRKVAELAREKESFCQVTLESRMACGVGACLGCVVATVPPDGSSGRYKRVCKEGPVFQAHDISWASCGFYLP